MTVKEDFISASLKSEVAGVSENDFAKPLRYIEPEFDPESDKDVQILFDENFFNHVFAYMYQSKHVYGVRKLVLTALAEVLPREYLTFLPIIESTVMPKIADKVMPGLLKAYPKAKQVDMRCDFQKKDL